MAPQTHPCKKTLRTCIYCANPPGGEEHWLNRSLGRFAGNTYLTGRLCTACNNFLGSTVDLELARTGPTGVLREVLNVEGRSKDARRSAFDYKASELEPPVQVFRAYQGTLEPVLEQALRRESDGTLVAARGRVLVIATPTGQRELRFPKGWQAEQLREAARRRDLLGGRLVSAHVPPPETAEEFVHASRGILRDVFGPFEIDVYRTRADGPVGPVEPTLLRFNLSTSFLRGVAKIAFHYFLWACPQVGGDEPEFSELRAFVRHGAGEPSTFLGTSTSLVERTPVEGGLGPDCHVFTSCSLGADLVVQTHFFSQSVGPSFPTFVVRLGRRPTGLGADWHTAHAAVYEGGIAGHDGTLRDLLSDEPDDHH